MDQIIAFDLERMVLGTEPALFYLEIVVRTVIIYAYALLLLRWLGSRTVGQLSTVEFLLVIALGTAIGDPMLGPDVPLLQAMLVVTLVVGINKGLDLLIARFKTAERIIDGTPEPVVTEGVICRTFLSSTSMGTSQLFQQLRERGIDQLPERERHIVRMHYFQAVPFKLIAKHLSVSEPRISQLHGRAMQMLKTALEKDRYVA